VNRTLIGTQLFDLILIGLPWTLLHFSRAVVGLVVFTLTGRYESKPKERRR
jgi:hypothetical protein